MLDALLRLFLMLVAMLVLVPAFTGGGVQVRSGGIFRGLCAMILICIVNWFIWVGFTALSLGLVIPLHFLTLGIVGLLFNALAFWATGKLFDGILYVRSFGSAFIAALVMTLASAVISHIL